MSYLVGMNDRFMQRFDNIDQRVTGLETSTAAMGREIADIRGSSSSMGQQISDLQASHTQHDQHTQQRFDDLYVMNNDNHHYLQDIYSIEYQMARFHIDSHHMPEVTMPAHVQRTDWSHPFMFPPPQPRPDLDDE